MNKKNASKENQKNSTFDLPLVYDHQQSKRKKKKKKEKSHYFL
jgi:hypothetical protein